MDYRQRILSLARSEPVLPTQVAKNLGIDSLMAGAMLSEMVSKGIIKVSSLKVGGSPVYYAPEAASKLLDFTSSLNEKDQRTVKLLESERVLRESDQDPLVRVSLKNVKDFALPLTVSYDGKEELFYKWFLLSDADAEKRIRDVLEPKSAPDVQKGAPEESSLEPAPEPLKSGPDKPVPEPRTSEPKAGRPDSRPKKVIGEIAPVVESFFRNNDIYVVERNVVRKDDVEYVVELPSPVGSLAYFCKVKGKKRVNDSDLSSAYVQGQLKKLPILFLIQGDLTKAAQELLPKLKGMVVKKL